MLHSLLRIHYPDAMSTTNRVVVFFLLHCVVFFYARFSSPHLVPFRSSQSHTVVAAVFVGVFFFCTELVPVCRNLYPFCRDLFSFSFFFRQTDRLNSCQLMALKVASLIGMEFSTWFLSRVYPINGHKDRLLRELAALEEQG